MAVPPSPAMGSGTIPRGLPDGELVVCPSRPDGIRFLEKYYAWGFVRFKRSPPYFALYVASPKSQIEFFGQVEAIRDVAESSEVLLELEDRRRYREGTRLVILRQGSLVKLANPIPMGRIKPPQSPIYSTLEKLRSAKTVDDLRRARVDPR